MNNAHSLLGIAAGVLVCLISSSAALAQHQHSKEHRAAQPGAARNASITQAPATGEPGVMKIGKGRFEIPDVELLDQHGRKVHLYSDLIKGRVVIVSFFFTSCTLICPAQAHALVKLQKRLAGRLGKEVSFISITTDPKTDTVGNLAQWAKRFDVGPGWTLLTGEMSVMGRLLWDLIGVRPGAQPHDAIVFIGNDRTGIWTNAQSLSAPERLVGIIDRIASPVGVSNN